MQMLRIVFPIAAMASGLWAQAADQPLSNADLQAMLVAGLPESTILLKLETAAARGLVDLDASSSALIILKQAGASEQVLNAVMQAEPFGAARKIQQEEVRAVPGLPSSAGVYFKAPAGWLTLSSFLLWPPLYSGSLWWRGRHEYSVRLNGGRSALQISETQPTFYAKSPPSRTWQIVHVASRNDQRLVTLVSTGDFFGTEGFSASQVLEVELTHLAGDVFTLRPGVGLQPGEYLLCGAVPGGDSLSACYDFGIQR